MANTPRLKLSLLAVGQSQKELIHNEALAVLDALVQSACVSGPNNTPPSSPVDGDLFICGTAPTGSWTGRTNMLALFTAAGWRFIAPSDGFRVLDRASGMEWRFAAGQWVSGVIAVSQVRIGGKQVLGSQGAAIAAPTGGTLVDAEGRAAIAQVISALRAHGLIAP